MLAELAPPAFSQWTGLALDSSFRQCSPEAWQCPHSQYSQPCRLRAPRESDLQVRPPARKPTALHASGASKPRARVRLQVRGPQTNPREGREIWNWARRQKWALRLSSAWVWMSQWQHRARFPREGGLVPRPPRD